MLNKRKHLHVKVNDRVMVITGDDRGTISNVIAVDIKRNLVKLANCNYKTHFTKKTKESSGSMEKKEGWLHASNVRRINSEN
jgi:ribosomal protein L24